MPKLIMAHSSGCAEAWRHLHGSQTKPSSAHAVSSDLLESVTMDFEPLSVEPCWMIGSRTRLLDCWEPQLEWIRMPPLAFVDRDYYAALLQDEHLHPFDDTKMKQKFTFRSSPKTISPNSFYDARAHGGDNIAHAIFGGAMATLVCQLAAKSLGVDSQITTVLPRKTKAYVREVFRLLELPIIETDQPVYGKAWVTNLDDHARIGLAKRVLPRSLINTLDSGLQDTPKRMYIARRGARSLRNASEIESLLKSRGFSTIYPEDLPVLDQFRFFWNADIVVGVHGAALASLIFRVLRRDKQPLQMIELFGPGYVVTLYRQLVAALGGKWVGVRGRLSPEVVRDLDEVQGEGLWNQINASRYGWAVAKLFKTEKSWQRTHQATSFELDPLALETALEQMISPTMEPSPRWMQF